MSCRTRQCLISCHRFLRLYARIFVLKEKVKPFQALAVIVAFIGALFIIKPQSISASFAKFCGNARRIRSRCGVHYGQKIKSERRKRSVYSILFSAFSCVVTLPYLIVDYSPMTIAQLVILICAGIAAAGGQFFDYCRIFIRTGKRNIGKFDYTQIIFAALMGFIAFGDIPDKFSIIDM